MHPIHLDSPICLDALYVWTPPICLDVPHTFGCPIHLVASKHTGGSQTHGGHPNIKGVSKHVGHPTIHRSVQTGGIQTLGECNMGGQNMKLGIQTYGVSKHTGVASKHLVASKHKGVNPNVRGHSNVWWAYGHPLSLTKHAFFVLLMYRGHPHVWGHMDIPLV